MLRQPTKVPHVCHTCGTSFLVHRCVDLRGFGKFCSRDCMTASYRAAAGSFEERVFARVDLCGPIPPHSPHLGQCWLWTGWINPLGYGSINSSRSGDNPHSPSLAHRVVYEMLRGPIASGLTLDHLCRVRHCVNPAHLDPCSAVENVLRGVGPSAVNSRKTHCKHGHEFSPLNTRITREGYRECRTCKRLSQVGRVRVRRRLLPLA